MSQERSQHGSNDGTPPARQSQGGTPPSRQSRGGTPPTKQSLSGAPARVRHSLDGGAAGSRPGSPLRRSGRAAAEVQQGQQHEEGIIQEVAADDALDDPAKLLDQGAAPGGEGWCCFKRLKKPLIKP